ncbi:hypothetical protein [Paraburkholderia sp. PGU19]|uniref:hypothetical protein n=1 Tax=Paraburkholderia sp. PGU19 TaxID=2735434 RepID=UPI0015DA46E2|nr:hypothetical protein [Paraburkholderia sp. PGU19]
MAGDLVGHAPELQLPHTEADAPDHEYLDQEGALTDNLRSTGHRPYACSANACAQRNALQRMRILRRARIEHAPPAAPRGLNDIGASLLTCALKQPIQAPNESV